MFLFIFIAIYIFSIADMEIICSKIYFSLLYELLKLEVQKLPKNGIGPNVFRIIVHLS